MEKQIVCGSINPEGFIENHRDLALCTVSDIQWESWDIFPVDIKGLL
jgi:hypothetical protein